MATTTVSIIRDRLSEVIAQLVPTSLAGDRYRESLSEYGGDIRAWALEHVDSALRRVQVRDAGLDDPPTVSDELVEQHEATIEIVICYPQTHRYGELGAIDRDRVIREDLHQVDRATGMLSRANLPAGSAYDACWIGQDTTEVERGEGIDFLVFRHRYLYKLER